MQPDNILNRDRLGLMSGALLLGLGFTRLVETPGRYLVMDVLGSPLGINLSGATLILLIMAALSVTSMEALLQGHPLVSQRQIDRTLIFWLMPALLVVGATGLLVRVDGFGAWAIGLLFSAIAVPLALASEYYAVDPIRRQQPLLNWGETLLIHLAALMMYVLIYGLRVRTLLSGPAVLLVTASLMFRLFYFTASGPRRALYYALAAGSIAGLLTWALNYAPLNDNQGALLLLLFFYVFNGLLQQRLSDSLGRREIIEYVLVAGVGIVILLFI
jgi:hypothetical protein